MIIEAHRTGTWAALVGAYVVETVEDCVAETQTGYQARTREHSIDAGVRLVIGLTKSCSSSELTTGTAVCGRRQFGTSFITRLSSR